jgi:hypothetical protein
VLISSLIAIHLRRIVLKNASDPARTDAYDEFTLAEPPGPSDM